MSRIVYLTKARIPTEKAHGFQVMKMCEAMAELGHEVELLHPRRAVLAHDDPFTYYGVAPRFRIRTLRNWNVVRLEPRLPDRLFKGLFAAHDVIWGAAAARRASSIEPDLVYTGNPTFAYWAARMGCASAFEAHHPPSRRTAPFVRALSRQASLRAVIATTSHTASELEAAGIPSEKLEVLPNAADLTAFTNVPPKHEVRRRLDLPADRPIVGYVGRFQTMGKEKGIADLIRAMAFPELRRSGALLLCVGGPMDVVTEYMALAGSAGVPSSALRFVDRVPTPEMPAWLAALDVAAMPYPAAEHYPTAMSPMKMFEYMAAGLPIVATNLPALREVLRDGDNALLAPAGNPEALAQRLALVLADAPLARELGERARTDAGQYTWHHRAERALARSL